MNEELSRIDINGVTYYLLDENTKATAVTQGRYNSSNQRIELLNANNNVVSFIDATNFIKDGMVSNVSIVNGNLVITFNTDSGKSPISIPLTSIFNPSNYYQKSEIDSKLAEKQGEISNLESTIGYYECSSEASSASKTIAALNYVLGNGGSMKVKMTNANTADNATLNINSTGAKPLFYDGERASANNSWEAGETVEVYYDGTSYYANNVAGVSDDGVFDVSAKYPTSGYEGGNTYTLETALAVLNANLPSSKKRGGMSVKFVHTSDNKYVQARCMAQSFTTDVTQWQGVDDKPTAGSDNLVKSGGVWKSGVEIDFNIYATKVDSDFTINQYGYTGVLLQENLIAGHNYIIAITSETTVSGETIIGCTSQNSAGKIDTITTNANLSPAITYLEYKPTVATRYLFFSTLRSANIHVVIKDKAVRITDNIIAALNETNTKLQQETNKTTNLNLKTLAIIPAKDYSVNDIIFTSESILPGTYGKIVGTAVSGATIGFYDKDNNKLLDSPSLLGENLEVAINVPLGYSYAKVLNAAYTLVSSSEFTEKTDVLMAKELLLEDKSSFKTLVLTKEVSTSTAIYTPIKKGNQYSIDIEFKAAHTNMLRIYIVDSSGNILKILYQMSSYTSATTKVFTLDRFTADIDGGGIMVQFVSYGANKMNVSLYNYVYPVDVNKRTIDKQIISRDLTTTQWSYISLSAQGITLKRGENYTITIKHSETVTKSIMFGTGQSSSAMVDDIGDAIEITSEGYTFDYSPTVDVNTIKIATSNALTYNITIVQHVTTYVKESTSKPVRFILITDCHYRPYEIDNHSYNDDGHADYTSDADTKWDGVTQNERLQMVFNALKKECQDGSIDFILSTGDTIQGDRDVNELGLGLFRKRFLSQISTPFFSCVGNHDMRYADSLYMENFYHHREFSFECGNLYFICPDFCSQQIKVSGSWSPDPLSIHLAWMNTEVAKAKERNMIPILCSHVSQTSDFYDQGAVYSTELYEWMKANDVHLYLVGHQHFIQEEKVSGYDIYRVCAGWFANRDPFYYKNNVTGWGYCVIDFKDGNFKVTQKVVEWNYANTQAKYDEYGQQAGTTPVEIGDNGYIEQSSTAYNSDVVSCDNLDGAMYRVESMSNFANCEDAIIEVPPMIPVSE